MVRYIGLFLEDPLDVPWPVVEHLAEQLGIEDVSCVKEYTERLKTAYEHAWEIRDAYGYHPFEDHAMGRKFRAFLHGRAWTAQAEGPKLERTSEPKRTAMLTAVMRHLEAKAIDDALDLFELLMATRLINRAKLATDKERLSTLPQLERAARITARVSKVFIEELELLEETGCDPDVAALWRALEEIAPRAELSSAAATVVSLVPEDDDSAESAMRSALALRDNTVRPFLSLLGESSMLGAATGGRRVLTGVQRLPALARRRVSEKPLLPREIDDKLVPPAWRKAVYANAELPEGAVDRDAYVVCVLEQLFRALKRRDVYASPSHRWSDPRARLFRARSGRRCVRMSWRA